MKTIDNSMRVKINVIEEKDIQKQEEPTVTPIIQETQPEIMVKNTPDIILDEKNEVKIEIPAKVEGETIIKNETRSEIIEKSIQKISEPYIVSDEVNVRDILKKRLGENEFFNQLASRIKNYIIDSLNDKIVHLSKQEMDTMGIPRGLHNIQKGDTIHFSVITSGNKELSRILKRENTTEKV